MNSGNAEGPPPHKEVRRIPALSGDDDIAKKESKAFVDNDYEEISRRKHHQRSESLKDTLHYFALWGIAILASILIVGVVIWAFHLLTPMYLHWLTVDQINEIQRTMASALLAIVVSDYAKKYFG